MREMLFLHDGLARLFVLFCLLYSGVIADPTTAAPATTIPSGIVFSSGSLRVVPGLISPGYPAAVVFTGTVAPGFTVRPRHLIGLTVMSPAEWAGEAILGSICGGGDSAHFGAESSLDLACPITEGKEVRSSLIFPIPSDDAMPQSIRAFVQIIDGETGHKSVQDLGSVVFQIAPHGVMTAVVPDPATAHAGDAVTLAVTGKTQQEQGLPDSTMMLVTILRPPSLAGESTAYPLCRGKGTVATADVDVVCPLKEGKIDFKGKLAWKPPVSASLAGSTPGGVQVLAYVSAVSPDKQTFYGGRPLQLTVTSGGFNDVVADIKKAEADAEKAVVSGGSTTTTTTVKPAPLPGQAPPAKVLDAVDAQLSSQAAPTGSMAAQLQGASASGTTAAAGAAGAAATPAATTGPTATATATTANKTTTTTIRRPSAVDRIVKEENDHAKGGANIYDSLIFANKTAMRSAPCQDPPAGFGHLFCVHTTHTVTRLRGNLSAAEQANMTVPEQEAMIRRAICADPSVAHMCPGTCRHLCPPAATTTAATGETGAAAATSAAANTNGTTPKPLVAPANYQVTGTLPAWVVAEADQLQAAARAAGPHPHSVRGDLGPPAKDPSIITPRLVHLAWSGLSWEDTYHHHHHHPAIAAAGAAANGTAAYENGTATTLLGDQVNETNLTNVTKSRRLKLFPGTMIGSGMVQDLLDTHAARTRQPEAETGANGGASGPQQPGGDASGGGGGEPVKATTEDGIVYTKYPRRNFTTGNFSKGLPPAIEAAAKALKDEVGAGSSGDSDKASDAAAGPKPMAVPGATSWKAAEEKAGAASTNPTPPPRPPPTTAGAAGGGAETGATTVGPLSNASSSPQSLGKALADAKAAADKADNELKKDSQTLPGVPLTPAGKEGKGHRWMHSFTDALAAENNTVSVPYSLSDGRVVKPTYPGYDPSKAGAGSGLSPFDKLWAELARRAARNHAGNGGGGAGAGAGGGSRFCFRGTVGRPERGSPSGSLIATEVAFELCPPSSSVCVVKISQPSSGSTKVIGCSGGAQSWQGGLKVLVGCGGGKTPGSPMEGLQFQARAGDVIESLGCWFEDEAEADSKARAGPTARCGRSTVAQGPRRGGQLVSTVPGRLLCPDPHHTQNKNQKGGTGGGASAASGAASAAAAAAAAAGSTLPCLIKVVQAKTGKSRVTACAEGLTTPLGGDGRVLGGCGGTSVGAGGAVTGDADFPAAAGDRLESLGCWAEKVAGLTSSLGYPNGHPPEVIVPGCNHHGLPQKVLDKEGHAHWSWVSC